MKIILLDRAIEIFSDRETFIQPTSYFYGYRNFIYAGFDARMNGKFQQDWTYEFRIRKSHENAQCEIYFVKKSNAGETLRRMITSMKDLFTTIEKYKIRLGYGQ